MKTLWERMVALIRERVRESIWARIALVLSIVVVFCTTYALVLPALTLTDNASKTVLQQEDPPSPQAPVTDASGDNSEFAVTTEVVDTTAAEVINEMDVPTVSETEPSTVKTETSISSKEDTEEERERKAREAGTFKAETDDVVVTVHYGADTFSEEVVLNVRPLENSSAYEAKINDLLNEQNQTLTVAHSYDISFKNKDGVEIEPSQEVQVSIDFKNKVALAEDLQAGWKLYHFKEDKVEAVEDLTEEKTTTIAETAEKEVTGINFKSDSFSPYILAGVQYADFSGYLTAASLSGSATYTQSTKQLLAQINLDYKIPQSALAANKSYAIELPADTSWGEGLQPYTDYTGKDGNRDAFKFRFIEQNGKKYLALTFLDTYVNSVAQGSDVKGDIYYNASIGESRRGGNGEYKIPYSDDVIITIPPNSYNEVPTPQENKYDLGSQKSGSVSYDGDTGILDYTVVVWSDKGTKETVKLKDTLTANGLTLTPLEVTSIKKSSYQYYYANEDNNPQTLTVQPNKISNTSFDLTLPKLEAKQKYTITYRYKVTGFPAGKATVVNNKLEVESPDVPNPGPKDNSVTLERNKISKSSSYDKDSNKITWTIKINENKNDIAGTVLTDTMFNQVKVADLKSTDMSGMKINANPDGTIKNIEFSATNGGRNTKQYTLTYQTDAGPAPQSWGEQSQNISNTATITDGGEPNSATSTAPKPNDGGNTGGLDKVVEKMTPTDNDDIKEVTWKSVIKMPADKKLPQNVEFEDILTGKDNSQTGEHYYTKAQLDAIYQKLTDVFGAGNVEFTIWPFDYYTYVPYEQMVSTKTYRGFKFKLLKPYTGSDISLTYNSTINKLSMVNFTNKISSSGFEKSATYKFEDTSKVRKMDGHDTVWDGQGREFDAKDTSHIVNKDGTIDWVVRVLIEDNTNKVTITDTPPAGLKLTGFTYGDATYSINSGDFTVTDTEVKWTNTGWPGGYGTDISVLGTIGSNGSVTVNFEAKNGKTLKEILKGSNKLYARFKFKSDVVPFDDDIVKEYTNKASATIDGVPSGEDDHTQKITHKPGQKIQKNGIWNNDSRAVEYSLTINPDKQDLVASKDTIEVTDTLTYQENLTTHLSYDLVQESVELLDESGKPIDKSLWSWRVEKTKDASGLYSSVMKLTVPDSQKLTLKYKYSVSQDVAADASASLTVKNKASISGLKTGGTEDSTDITWQKINAGGTAQSNKFFKITKVDVANFGIILPGAIFEVRENLSDKVVATYKTGADGSFYITQDSKEAQPGSVALEENKLYYAIEVKAPMGYVLPEEDARERYFFYYSPTGTIPINSGTSSVVSNEWTNLAKQSRQVYLENEKLPDETSITVHKIWQKADGKETERVDGQIELTLKQIATEADGTSQEKDYATAIVTFADNWMKKFDQLPVQGQNAAGASVNYTYYVVEKAVSGYSTMYGDATSSSALSETPKDFAIQSGGINVINKANKEYSLPKTGGIGPEKILWMGLALSILTISLISYQSYKRYQGGGSL
ncbi:Cna B-type domain-containing protein [Streptococcus ovis]|uniref:Cna B-type domain-containing protein n=1 Tax=Streptococcus ovis TaxID=82806 RepID=UPI000475659A|nr:Cna B-type domain-containing protein [Streptococcus ovis]